MACISEKKGGGDGKGGTLEWRRVRGTKTDTIEDLRCHLSSHFSSVALGTGSAQVPMCLRERSTGEQRAILVGGIP